MSRTVATLAFLIGLVVVQVSFLSTWPFPVNQVHLVLVVLVFVTTLLSYSQGLWWAFTTGLLLELSTSLPFGVTTLTLLSAVMMSNQLFAHFFTNRSLYALLAIGLLATWMYGGMSAALGAFFGPFFGSMSRPIPWTDVVVQLLWQSVLHSLLLGCLLFSFTTIFRRRLHSAHVIG